MSVGMFAALMAKRPLNITAQRVGQRAEIRIEGVIGNYEKANAKDIDWAIKEMVAGGVRDAHVYLDSEGGSVIEAKRIITSLRKFSGRITGEGGAIVASAASYLGLKLDEFLVRKDTMYMIHKPSGGAFGNEDEVESELKAIKDITKEYRAAYAAKTGKTEDEIEALWSKGDRWYTGDEAFAEGFVDGLVDEEEEEEELDDITGLVAILSECGCPKHKIPLARLASRKTRTMDIKALRVTLGMPETATESEVLARVGDLKTANERHTTEAAAAQGREIKAILDKAIADKKMTEAHRASYETKFKAAFDATKAEVEGLTAAPNVAEEVRGNAAAAGAVASGREAWTYGQWHERDEKGLKALMTSDPAKFTALYEAQFGVKPVLPKA